MRSALLEQLELEPASLISSSRQVVHDPKKDLVDLGKNSGLVAWPGFVKQSFAELGEVSLRIHMGSSRSMAVWGRHLKGMRRCWLVLPFFLFGRAF